MFVKIRELFETKLSSDFYNSKNILKKKETHLKHKHWNIYKLLSVWIQVKADVDYYLLCVLIYPRYNNHYIFNVFWKIALKYK